ncbi:MAG: deoxynucleoside kinase [Anaerolineaceae bacterium]|jgi:deoxyadenosine/deoxycytidine kinase|nr:deoxynucleoside kinase [Anaerolineaceae bacterium]
MPKRLILVAGNIGSGKTSLTERIGERMHWKTAYESVADNPYLPDFYANMKQWSFHLQIFFLGHRAQQHLDMYEDSHSAIIDRSIYEDAYIFVRALHEMGNITERDYATYRQVFDIVVKKLPAPSLLIYLEAPVDTLIKRIQCRGREMESSISRDYLELLDSFYQDWIAHFDLCPVLTIHTDDLDFVHEPKHLDTVVQKIQEKLAGKEEIKF